MWRLRSHQRSPPTATRCNSAQHGTAATQLVYTFAAAPGHNKAAHVEGPARIAAIEAELRRHGLDERHPQVALLQPGPPSDSRVAAALELVHPASYLQRLAEVCASLAAPTLIDDSTYISPHSLAACRESAAAVLRALDAVLPAAPEPAAGGHHPASTMGFCLVRPPGHHVKPSRPMGFGLLNLVAMAAAHALQQPGINRVLIVDWDVHHGNGTEDIFWGRSDVLYISSHQQGLWPYTGKLTSVGGGEGRGHTINVPLPGDAGHAAMQAVWQEVVLPAAHRFKPDIILSSAGYDAHFAEELAGLQFEPRTYYYLCQQTARLARQLCGGRALWVLEGGYSLDALALSVASSFAGILEQPCPEAEGATAALLREEPRDKVRQVLQQVLRTHGL